MGTSGPLLLLLALGTAQARQLDLNKDDEWLVAYDLNSTIEHHLSVYLFDLTNPEEFLGGAKPRFVEKGPYVYREAWQNSDVKWHGDGEVEYRLGRTYTFDPKRSKGNLQTDKFTTINIPFVAALHTQKSPTARMAIGSILQITGMKSYGTYTVGEFLFGYDDPVITLGRAVAADPSKVYPHEKFGLLAGWNDTHRNRPTINTGLTSDGPLGNLVKLDGKSSLGIWQKGSKADSVRGSKGIMFKPDVGKGDKLHLFSTRYCRALPLEYQKEVISHSGMRAKRFTAAKKSFSARYLREAGFCSPGASCNNLPNGVMDVGPCHNGAPIIFSPAHFLGADRSLLDSVEGLRPSMEKHQVSVDVTSAGPTVGARVPVQINVGLSKVDDVLQARGLRDMVFPVAYTVSDSTSIRDPVKEKRLKQIIRKHM